jgi:hypothetical protein
MISARTTTPSQAPSKPQQLARRAEDVLGPAHPLASASRWRDILIAQAVGASCLLLAATALALIRRTPSTIAFATCSLIVELWVIPGAILAVTVLRERAREGIADGEPWSGIAEVSIERERLVRRRTRARLARTLERALYAAEHWHEMPISTRPPQGVSQLAFHSAAVRDIVRLVRDPASDVRGLALLDRLLRDGYSSALYRGPSCALEEELRRIRYLLS